MNTFRTAPASFPAASRGKRIFVRMMAVVCVAATLCGLFLGSLLVLSTSPIIMESRFSACADSEALLPLREHYGELAEMVTAFLRGEKQEFQYEFCWEGRTYEAFRENERQHMADVRALFSLADRLTLALVLLSAAGIALLLLTHQGRILRKAFLWGIPAFTVLLAGVAIGCLFDFETLFIAFHRLFFTNELWLLNPATDCLILLMPIGFFTSYSAMMLGLFLFLVGLLWCGLLFGGRGRG